MYDSSIGLMYEHIAHDESQDVIEVLSKIGKVGTLLCHVQKKVIDFVFDITSQLQARFS